MVAKQQIVPWGQCASGWPPELVAPVKKRAGHSAKIYGGFSSENRENPIAAARSLTVEVLPSGLATDLQMQNHVGPGRILNQFHWRQPGDCGCCLRKRKVFS